MIKGKTEAGFKFEVNENIGKDFRIVIATKKINADSTLDKVSGIYDYTEAILGKDGVEKMVEFATDKKGYADTEFILEQANEILAFATEKSAEVKK